MRFLIFIVAVLFFACQDTPASDKKMTGLAGAMQDSSIVRVWPIEVDSLLKINLNIPIIDVRSETEFRTSHIFRSMNCGVNDPDFDKRIIQLDRSAPVIVYDQNSYFSLMAAQKMKTLGFQRVYEIAGGIQSWATAGKSLVASPVDSATVLR